MPIGDLAGEIALVVTAAIIILFAAFAPRHRQWLAAVLALAGCATSALLIAQRMLDNDQFVTFSGSWAADDVTGWAELIILAVTAIVVLLSPEWLRGDARHGEWYAILLFSAAGAMVMAGTADLLLLMMGVLLSSATGYVLASYHRRSALSVEAGAKYFLVGALTNAVLLIGITLLFGLAGATTYQDIERTLSSGTSTVVAVAVVVLVIIGLAFKIGAVPSHLWMPDVAQGAPAPAAAFLTIAPKVGGMVALARLLSVLPDDVVGWRPVVAAVAAATMTVGNLAALWQHDVRRLLGWSSVSQSGYALMAVVVVGRSPDALDALVVFLAAYAVGQLAAFAVVTELRGRTALEDYRGLFTQRPLLAGILTLAMLSFVGIPPLAGFAGKLLLFETTIDGGYTWLAALAVANSVVSLFYYLRVIGPMSFAETKHAPEGGPAASALPPAVVPVLGHWAATGAVLSGVLVVGLGIGVESLLGPLAGATLFP